MPLRFAPRNSTAGGAGRVNQSLNYAIQGVMPAALATGLFVSLCTIQAPDQLPQGPTGNPPGTYSNVAGRVDIPCMDAPPSIARIQATEMKDVAEILSKGLRHVLLGKCFADAPDWSGAGYRAVVDGVVYDLMGAENDSQNTQTRIDLQLATVAGG